MQKKLIGVLFFCILANVVFFIFQINNSNNNAISQEESETKKKASLKSVKTLLEKTGSTEVEKAKTESTKTTSKIIEKTEDTSQFVAPIEAASTYKKKFKPEEEKTFGEFFRNGKRRSESFDTEEYDPEWAPRLTEQIFDVGGIEQNSGLNRIPNLNVLYVECKNTQCKVKIDLLGSKEENSIAFRDFQLALLKLNKHPTKLMRNRMVHRLRNGDIYVSRGTND